MKNCFKFYTWAFLFLNIIVILDGALVRATNSGAGCGAFWPLCHGTVLPDLRVFNTLIEFTHRISSGLVGIGALLLALGAFYFYPKHHLIRKGSLAVLFFVFCEALVGAALVLFGLVEQNTSLTRVFVMVVHLITTFFLLASIALTASLSSGFSHSFHLLFIDKKNIQNKYYKRSRLYAFMCLGLLLLTGISGAITALGDTLFKPSHIAENVLNDFMAPKHILYFLRSFHPLIALIASGVLAYFVSIKFQQYKKLRKISFIILSFIAIQIVVGMANLLFFTPVLLQIIHLFIADILWILSILYFNEFCDAQTHEQLLSQREP